MHTNAHRKMPRPFKPYSLINIRAMCEIFTGSGLHMHTVELMLIQGSNINKTYLINVKQHNFFLFNYYLKNYLTKPYMLYRLQSSNPLQNITNAVQFQQDILQLCKLKSKRRGCSSIILTLQQKDSSTARIEFIIQFFNTTLHTGNQREYLNPHHSLIYFTIL